MINLLYCGNDKVFDGIMISLLSIVKYLDEPINVYVMTMDLREANEANVPVSQSQVDFLEKLIQRNNSQSRVYLIDITDVFKQDMGDSPNIKNFYTPYTLVRLFADMVPEIPDRILYLDTDTIASDSIKPIFDTDMDNVEFAGVIDYLGKFFIKYNYMNAGVLYMNMPQIRNKETFRKAREMCRNKKMAFPDQDALNKCVSVKKFIPTRYNEQRMNHKDTCIRHFCKTLRLLPYFHTINIKPWHIDKMHEVYKLFIYDDILNEYSSQRKIYEEM